MVNPRRCYAEKPPDHATPPKDPKTDDIQQTVKETPDGDPNKPTGTKAEGPTTTVVDSLKDYMDAERSGAWSRWGIEEGNVLEFKEIYPTEAKLKILVELAEKDPTLEGVEKDFRRTGLDKFIPVVKEIVAEARRLMATAKGGLQWEGVQWAANFSPTRELTASSLNQCLAESGVFVEDRSRQDFIEFVFKMATSNLYGNETSRVLLAPRGLGKTSLLKGLTRALPQIFPCVAIYLDHRQADVPLRDVIYPLMESLGVELKYHTMVALYDTLREQGLKLFVFTDELEEVLLRRHGKRSEEDFRDLHGLGTFSPPMPKDVNHWWVLTTGSDTRLPRLRRDLNGRKYRPLLLDLPHPNSIQKLCEYFEVPQEYHSVAWWVTGGLPAKMADLKYGLPQLKTQQAMKVEHVNILQAICQQLTLKVVKKMNQSEEPVVLYNKNPTDDPLKLGPEVSTTTLEDWRAAEVGLSPIDMQGLGITEEMFLEAIEHSDGILVTVDLGYGPPGVRPGVPMLVYYYACKCDPVKWEELMSKLRKEVDEFADDAKKAGRQALIDGAIEFVKGFF